MNSMAGILRGTGNMKLPSLMILCSAVCQVILGGILGLGLGPIPSFGMRGVAAGTLIAFLIGAAIMAWYIFSGGRVSFPKSEACGFDGGCSSIFSKWASSPAFRRCSRY